MDYGVMELYINEGQKVSKQFEKLIDYELDNFINYPGVPKDQIPVEKKYREFEKEMDKLMENRDYDIDAEYNRQIEFEHDMDTIPVGLQN